MGPGENKLIHNKLKNLRVYLSGPIDRCPHGGAPWRNSITPYLQQMGVTVFNPLNQPFESKDKISREERSELKICGKFETFSSIMEEVRTSDLHMVNVSDFIIVYLDLEIYACGTMEEIFLANRQKKIIIIVCPQGKNQIPDWLFGTLPHDLFFTNIYEALYYLQGIDWGLDDRTFGHWHFFREILLRNNNEE